MIPFRYGDYSAIRSPFMPEDYDRVSAKWRVIASVTMEGEWDWRDPVGEAIWMQRLADNIGRPAAHAAHVRLNGEDLENVLQTLKTLPLVKSVRYKPRANHAPGGAPGGMMDLDFRSGFKQLAKQGLMFELQTPWWHLSEAISLAELAPETPIILNHAGLPSNRSAAGVDEWRSAMAKFAKLPQAYVKISGLGLAGHPWQIEDNRTIILTTIDLFGPDRCMFASNFPVDGLCGSFDTIFSGFDAATSELSSSERAALFCENATRLYGINTERL